MSWQTYRFEPQLPPHCEPTTDFLYRFSSTFHVCVPTDLAFASTLLGSLSIVSWLFAQLPQIYKNYALQSTSGLSIYFLVEWCLGDLSNLLGAIFTRQANWQIIVAGYYCFVDFILVLQWVWYTQLKHGKHFRQVWFKSNAGGGEDGGERVIEGVSISEESPPLEEQGQQTQSKAKDIVVGDQRLSPAWRIPKFGTPTEKDEKTTVSPSSFGNHLRVQPSSSVNGPSPRTVLFLACLIALAHASPITPEPQLTATSSSPTAIELSGTALSWLSTALYLLSRLPQLYKNYRRRSTSGLSPHLFMAAFFGNLFYSASIICNPNAWSSYPAYGGGGWASEEGNDRMQWVLRALPFWLGAAGVLALDGAMGAQFVMFGEGPKIVVVVDDNDDSGRHPRWKRVSGYMRGWVPSFSERGSGSDGSERRMLLDDGGQGSGYGTNDA
ncbi:hypothetical protein MBLNU457_6128t1 [Dothideomycetes sp. NU457]